MIKTGIESAAYFGITDYREGLQKLKALNEIGYNGCISLETSISRKMPEPIRE